MNGLTALAFLACVTMAFGGKYLGTYRGSCGPYDGIYSNGRGAITFCSGGVATEQRCAPGTSHSYKAAPGAYGYGAGLCDVNRIDDGHEHYIAQNSYRQPSHSGSHDRHQPSHSNYRQPSHSGSHDRHQPSHSNSYNSYQPSYTNSYNSYQPSYSNSYAPHRSNSYAGYYAQPSYGYQIPHEGH